jgi:hypothetical protein
MNNPDQISESLKTIFWVKIIKFFDVDLGWEKFGSGIRDGKKSDPGSGSAILNNRFRSEMEFLNGIFSRG